MKTASADAARREQEYAKRLDAEREAMRAEMEAAQSRVMAVTDEKERLEQHNRQLQLTLVVGPTTVQVELLFVTHAHSRLERRAVSK